VLSLVTGCLTDSDDGDKKDDNGNTVVTKKKLTLNYKDEIKLFDREEIDLEVTIDPPAKQGEMLLWTYAGPDSVERWFYPANRKTDMGAMSFTEGDWRLTVDLVDSLEFEALGLLAPDYGTVSLLISVRKITVDIQAEVTGKNVVFTAYSPQQSWLPNFTEYRWDFGDGDTATLVDTTKVSHTYVPGGDYDVKLVLAAKEADDDIFKQQIAADSTIVKIQSDPVEELTLSISPQDTTWNTAFGISLSLESSLDRYDYPEKVKWVIDYGDGERKEEEAYLGDRSISHRYYVTGDFILDVSVYDTATNELLGQDSAVVHITNLPFIQETNYFRAAVWGYSVEHNGTLDSQGTFTETSTSDLFSVYGTSTSELNWDGTAFSVESTTVSGTQEKTRKISGQVSDDATMLVRMEYTLGFSDPDYQGSGRVWTYGTRLVIENLPLSAGSVDRYYFYRQNVDVGQYVTAFEDWSKMLDPKDGTAGYRYRDYFDWQNTADGTPKIELEFKQE